MNKKIQSMNRAIIANRRNEKPEYIDWCLYSSVVCGTASTTVTHEYFATNAASAGRDKTNMETPAQLNSQKTFLVNSIEMIIFNDDGQPFRSDNAIAYGPNLIAASFYGDFIINQVVMLELHGWMFRKPHERIDAATTVGAAASAEAGGRIFRLSAPIQIDPQTNFKIIGTHTNPAATGGFSATTSEIMFKLNGYMLRKR